MEDLKLFIGFSRMLLHVDRKTSKVFRDADLTKGQFAVLEVLHTKGRLSASQIRKLILMTPGNLPVILKNLEAEDYIRRLPNPADGRSSLLELTDRGEKKLLEVFPKNQEVIEDLFSVWTEEEKELLLKSMKKFRDEYMKEET